MLFGKAIIVVYMFFVFIGVAILQLSGIFPSLNTLAAIVTPFILLAIVLHWSSLIRRTVLHYRRAGLSRFGFPHGLLHTILHGALLVEPSVVEHYCHKKGVDPSRVKFCHLNEMHLLNELAQELALGPSLRFSGRLSSPLGPDAMRASASRATMKGQLQLRYFYITFMSIVFLPPFVAIATAFFFSLQFNHDSNLQMWALVVRGAMGWTLIGLLTMNLIALAAFLVLPQIACRRLSTHGVVATRKQSTYLLLRLGIGLLEKPLMNPTFLGAGQDWDGSVDEFARLHEDYWGKSKV
jgi:hypothetical protein